MHYIPAAWPAPSCIQAYTTLKSGYGDPQSPFQDEAATRQLIALLQLPSAPLWIKQTHSTVVIEASATSPIPEADASFTTLPNQVCTVLTADCLPVFICDQAGSQVAVVHAGWRGLANGIIENTIAVFNAPSNNLLAYLGPAIGPLHFEVSMDVYHAFTITHPDAVTAFTPLSQDKWLCNLYELAKMRLRRQGVLSIYGGDYCTFSDNDLFYSYRRDPKPTGRMASVIWIDSTS